MKVNAFGVLMRVAIALWTVFCFWQFGSSMLEIVASGDSQDVQHGRTLAVFFFWGAAWFVVSAGLGLMYGVFGRSRAT